MREPIHYTVRVRSIVLKNRCQPVISKYHECMSYTVCLRLPSPLCHDATPCTNQRCSQRCCTRSFLQPFLPSFSRQLLLPLLLLPPPSLPFFFFLRSLFLFLFVYPLCRIFPIVEYRHRAEFKQLVRAYRPKKMYERRFFICNLETILI